jgi:hypothetical protein
VVLPALLLFASNAQADATNQAPEFKEVYELIRSHLTGVTDSELNRASVDGLLAQLRGKVSIAGRDEINAANNEPASRVSVLDDGVACLRLSRVANGLAQEISAAWQRLNTTNQINGLVLDLRFAGGNDYEAAAAVADLFTAKERVLLDWGGGVARSKAKSDAISLPVAVLVNGQTSGAAEALAAVMRETGTALLLGGTTAGTATVAKEFPLKNGQRLLIATQPVKLGDGTVLSMRGVKPDIEVTVSPEAERDFVSDASANVANGSLASGNTGTSRAADTSRAIRRMRLSEADLVRERREGTTNVDDLLSGRDRELDKPVIQDPALARAVDLLKGLAVVRRARS